MVEVTILETKLVGDLTAVTVELQSPELNSVDEVVVEELDRSSAYHQSLHDNRITHRHNKMKVQATVYLPGEFSQTALDAALAPSIASLEAQSLQLYEMDTSVVQEHMYINGGEEKTFYKQEDYPAELREAFVAVFPDVDLSAISLISSPSFHSLLNQDVVSTFLWEDDVEGLTIDGTPAIARSRKFCMTAGAWYDRVYTFATGETFPFLPPEFMPLAKSFHTNIGSGIALPDFYDVYFTGTPALVEEVFELPPKQGSASTYYAVTVVNGEVVRAKQYIYDSNTAFYDWKGTVKRALISHGMEISGLE